MRLGMVCHIHRLPIANHVLLLHLNASEAIPVPPTSVDKGFDEELRQLNAGLIVCRTASILARLPQLLVASALWMKLRAKDGIASMLDECDEVATTSVVASCVLPCGQHMPIPMQMKATELTLCDGETVLMAGEGFHSHSCSHLCAQLGTQLGILEVFAEAQRQCLESAAAVGAHLFAARRVDHQQLEAQTGAPQGEVVAPRVLLHGQIVDVANGLHAIVAQMGILACLLLVQTDCTPRQQDAVQLLHHALIVAEITPDPKVGRQEREEKFRESVKEKDKKIIRNKFAQSNRQLALGQLKRNCLYYPPLPPLSTCHTSSSICAPTIQGDKIVLFSTQCIQEVGIFW